LTFIRRPQAHPNSTHQGDAPRYALSTHNDSEVPDRRPDAEQHRINNGTHDVPERPNATGWLRLKNVDAATTVRYEHDRTLPTDGPFVDSKDYLGGFVVEADNLDGALAIAGELQELRAAAAIKIRPVLDANLAGALADLPRGSGLCPGIARRPARRRRAGRRRRPAGVRDRRRTLAAARTPSEPYGLADHDRPPPRH
jgi:hypothetical protein